MSNRLFEEFSPVSKNTWKEKLLKDLKGRPYEKMIKLSGLELGKDIQLAFTGLRPGEKLYEELLNDEENTLPTHHKKIMVAKVREYEFEKVSADIEELIGLFDTQDNNKIVSKMKRIVPEFLSKNSIFEELDEEVESDLDDKDN